MAVFNILYNTSAFILSILIDSVLLRYSAYSFVMANRVIRIYVNYFKHDSRQQLDGQSY